MIPQINVISVVDTVGVLSSDCFDGNLHMADNSRSSKTVGQGSDALCSAVTFTQVINWHAWAIDVQTDVLISGIRWFRDGKLIASVDEEPVTKSKLYGAPSGSYWAAIVKPKGEIDAGMYQYQLQIAMEQKKEWMASFPALFIGSSEELIESNQIWEAARWDS